jgi:hypothetical protein
MTLQHQLSPIRVDDLKPEIFVNELKICPKSRNS